MCLQYKFMYLWFRLRGNTPCESRGKLARWITRNVGISIEEILEELNR